MSLAAVLYLIALILALIAAFTPEVWRPRALAAAVALCALAGLITTGAIHG